MSDPAQRNEWAKHMKDEARAIARQQASAGASHGPVEGPLPYSHDNMAVAVRAAVDAERERCAKVAASFASDAQLLLVLGDVPGEQRAAGAAVARRIAQALGGPASDQQS